MVEVGGLSDIAGDSVPAAIFCGRGPDVVTEDHGEAPAQGQHFVNKRSGGFATSALIVATELCLRGIVASARMMQYSPRSLATKIVSGDTFASMVVQVRRTTSQRISRL